MAAAPLVFFGGWALRRRRRAPVGEACARWRGSWGVAAPHPGEGQAGFSEAGSSDKEPLPHGRPFFGLTQI